MGRVAWVHDARLVIRGLLVAVLLAVAAAPARPAIAQPTIDCQERRLAVALAAGEPTRYQVATTLCRPRESGTVHVLVSGASYGRVYWDFPYRPEVYSSVRALNSAGYATLNIDRIGLGESDRPPAEAVTIESNAYVVHQLVQALRRGAFGGAPFERVVTVGHSLGVGVVWVEAARHADVDGVIVTDGMHTPSPGLAVAVGSFYPAQLDARFAAKNLPPGYLTTVPGRRGALFYYEPGAEGEVIARDEATKETATPAELATLALSADASFSRSIKVPVLSVIGEFDKNFCDIPCSDPDSLAPAMEGQYYAPAACLEIFVVPDAGHDINLHRSAPIWYRAAAAWSDRRVGVAPTAPRPGCASPAASPAAPSGPRGRRPSIPATGGVAPAPAWFLIVVAVVLQRASRKASRVSTNA